MRRRLNPTPGTLALVVVLGATTLSRPAHALDPRRAITQYALMKWGAGRAAPAGVNAIVQTPDRYLWLASSAGLMRFDGSGFVVYDAENTSGFGEGGVTHLVAGDDGTLFYGTRSGHVGRMNDGHFATIDHDGGAGLLSAMVHARDGGLWFALFGKGAFHWSGRGAAQRDGPPTPIPLTFAEDPHGTIWFGTEHSGLRTSGGVIPSTPIPRRLGQPDAIQVLHWDHQGRLWMGTPSGLFVVENGQLRRFGREAGLSHENITALLDDTDGNLWVGTSGGLNRRAASGRWSALTSVDGLNDDEVRTLFEDDERNLWIGTASGLNSLSDTRFFTYGRAEGLTNPRVSAVAPGASGTTWIGGTEAGLYRLRNGQLARVALPNAPGLRNVLSLHEARDGTLWVRANNRLFSLKNGHTAEYRSDVEGSWITAISEDAQGPLFYVKGVGLTRLASGRFVPYVPIRDLDYVHQILPAHDGTLWIAGSRGLAHVAGATIQRYGTAEGLRAPRVRWISEEKDGSLWLATEGGLGQWKNGRIRVLTDAQGLRENYLSLVLPDDAHLWVTSSAGVTRLQKAEVERALDDPRARVTRIEFNTADGLRTVEMPLTNNPGFRGDDGRLWFATARGVSVVDPHDVWTDDAAPLAVIQHITVDGRATELERARVASDLRYGPGPGHVRIDFTALRYRSASGIHLRYRLEGLEPEWIDAEARRSVSYGNLAPGVYTFRVEASNADGVWNRTPAALSFAIEAPFRRTKTFYAVVVLLASVLLAAAHMIRVGQMNARFREVMEERTRIARELHDTIAQGLAGTTLQLQAASSVLPDRPGVAQTIIDQAQQMVRSTLEEARRSIWVLRAQTSMGPDGLESALAQSLGQLTEPTRLVPQIQIEGEPRPLPPEVERNLLRVAHEAVTNAVRHSGAKSLAVQVAFASDGVHLRVRDDGRGFDPAPWLGRQRGDHFGLVGMSERIRGAGGEFHVTSREGEGTEIGCRLPYRNRRASHGGSPRAAL
jgi:signal transduction histidine kinase/ligand-binding sensor domain-containing protein